MPLATTFSAPGMDCPTEERLIRMALEPDEKVLGVSVDLSTRSVVVTHEGIPDSILRLMEPLGFGAKIEKTEEVQGQDEASNGDERKVLLQLLAINGLMFLAELVAGILAQSAGLLADSLDMLADALVYSISVYAVGKGASLQARAAKLSGVLQLVLAAGIGLELVRRLFSGSEPQSTVMIATALAALAANLSCVWLLRRHREGGVHMQASWIFSTNDAIANLGVVLAGVLVLLTDSMIPDLVIALAITALVTRGALRILRLSTSTGAGRSNPE